MTGFDRRTFVAGLAMAGLITGGGRRARADDLPGVTDAEIKIGSTTSLSGPVSALGIQARCQDAFFRMVNEAGGIAGRKITYIYYDDGFSPPRTVEQTRRLVESDGVAFLFNTLGTAPNSAIVKYLNQKKVPHLFLSVNGDKWGDYKTNPWTMGFAPSARIEAQIFAKHALQQNPSVKFAILYQNDDLGKDYVAGVRDVLQGSFEKQATTVPHEVSDPTVDSQIVQLKQSGADVLLSGTTAKFVAQSIKRVYELQWKPTHYIANGAASIAGVLIPAGAERSTGVIASAYLKDATDPTWADDAGTKEYVDFLAKYFPDGKMNDSYILYAYTVAGVLMKVLEQCNGTFTRENIMKQATSLKDLQMPTMLPGILVNTSPTNYHPIRQVQLQRFDGAAWKRFGGIIEGAEI
ncbi:ABC transporter substrate-binding protein [Chelatococcus reniformis]|uniref:Branched-chain amino acid ABC transporter substrate-binding protein n=1 Tax=Chelatococcus reniformis TaxID=1494448 RepID=A0A916XP12_9HYPH|nr:ABC transporter substrate-binding protein [Chelatococcus reniformis]GGC87327.1 branched-chain amino acid ABC transporter substrate-binding protein [Chelatococcus reniformis]